MFAAFAGLPALIAAYGVSAVTGGMGLLAIAAGDALTDPSVWANAIGSVVGPVVHYFKRKNDKEQNDEAE